jgi:hypothetical protein
MFGVVVEGKDVEIETKPVETRLSKIDLNKPGLWNRAMSAMANVPQSVR